MFAVAAECATLDDLDFTGQVTALVRNALHFSFLLCSLWRAALSEMQYIITEESLIIHIAH